MKKFVKVKESKLRTMQRAMLSCGSLVKAKPAAFTIAMWKDRQLTGEPIMFLRDGEAKRTMFLVLAVYNHVCLVHSARAVGWVFIDDFMAV